MQMLSTGHRALSDPGAGARRLLLSKAGDLMNIFWPPSLCKNVACLQLTNVDRLHNHISVNYGFPLLVCKDHVMSLVLEHKVPREENISHKLVVHCSTQKLLGHIRVAICISESTTEI